MNECQHSFIPGKSCTNQLIQSLDEIGSHLVQGKQIVIYLDMSKAFDEVCHNKMINKLCNVGFRSSLFSWFQACLQNRKQQVTVLGTASPPLPVTSGVSQGSILGPMLFLIYVNDPPNAINSSKIATFV